MASVKEVEPVRQGAEAPEVARLRRELDEVRTRLEEETAYFRAELETSRQRVEKQYVREHASEVAKRRRVEAKNLALAAELRQALAEAGSVRERCDELARELAQHEEFARRHTERELEKVRATAAVAWQSAEEELARLEQEHAADKRLLADERAKRVELEQALERSRMRAAEGPDPDSMRLIGSLKKALWATGHARRRAEVQLAALRTSTETAQADVEAPPAPPAPAAPSTGFAGNAPVYNELTLDDLKAVSFGDMSDELSEDFLLTMGDASLDDPGPPPQDPPSAAASVLATPVPQPTAPEALPAPQPVPRPQVIPAYEMAGRPSLIDRSRQGIGRVLRDLLIGLAMTAAGYWLLKSGLLATLLG